MRRLRALISVAFLLIVAGCAPTPPAKIAPPPAPQGAAARFDLIIRDGTVVDGSGGPPRVADVGIRGDRIAAVGSLAGANADREMAGRGLVVAPGFINPHSHTHDSINPYVDFDATASLMQGITTEIGGVDGRSPVPVTTQFTELTREGTGVNFGLFVGQGSMRKAVMGKANRRPTAPELERMKSLVRESMAAGAFGVSSGLEYLPGGFADTAEVTALVAESRPYGGIYSTHLRSEGDRITEALDEALHIGQAAGVPVNLSHLKIVKFANWSKERPILDRIERARSDGVKLFADVYPYLAPDWAINRPLAEWAGSPPSQLVIVQATDRTLVGKTLAEVAAMRAWAPEEVARRLLAVDPGVKVVAQVNSESAMQAFLTADWSVIGTDGESQPKLADPIAALQFHPRSYGTYTRLLGQYVRDKQLMPLEAMVRKMTGAVADNLHLKDRGYIRPDAFADLVVFDPASVADRTTWLTPQEYPAGIRAVLVNGQVAVWDGKRQPGRPGRIIRHE